MERYREITVTNPETQETTTMLEMIAPRMEKTGKGEPYHQCAVCGFFYPESKLTKIAGKYYCSHYGCINDVRGQR